MGNRLSQGFAKPCWSPPLKILILEGWESKDWLLPLPPPPLKEIPPHGRIPVTDGNALSQSWKKTLKIITPQKSTL